MHRIRLLLLVLVFFVAVGVCSASAAGPPPETSLGLSQKIKKLDHASGEMARLHARLELNLNEVVRLHQRAEANLQGNALKVFLKGSLEIFQKVTSPLNSAFDLVAESLGSLYLEPLFYQVDQDRVVLLNLSRRAEQRSRKLRVLYQSLGQVMAAEPSRFDDDQPPFAYTSRSWKKGDGKKDDAVELTTRKLKVIYDLTGLIERQTRQEMAAIREDRRQLINQRAAMTQRLAKVRAEEQVRAREVGRFNEMMARRMKQAARTNQVKSDGRGGTANARPYVRLTPEERAFKDRLDRENRARSEQSRRTREAAKKDWERLAKETQVYVLSDCSRHVVAGEKSVFIAAIDPPVLKGSFIWELDDRRIGQGRVLTYTFRKEDVHDLSVTFYSRGKYVDRYLDQVRVFPAPAAPEPPLYPAALEGKKTPAMAIKCCNYWILHQNNRVYLTGYYRAITGRRINYTSEAIKLYNPAYPAAGLFALKNGTGYHVYVTYGEGPGSHYNVCRMKGEEVKIIHRLTVDKFSLDFAPDYSKAYISYRNHDSNVDRKIVLD